MTDTPVWTPEKPEHSKMWSYLQYVNSHYNHAFQDYEALHAWSVAHPADFWESFRNFAKLDFDHPARSILEEGQHPLEARWFEGARFNFAEKLLSRRDDKTAIISISETGDVRVLSYKALYQAVASLVDLLQHKGIGVGDRVAGVMANTEQAIIAMLATTALGGIWSSCSPDFGLETILDRLSQVEPKLLFFQAAHQYMGKTHTTDEKIAAVKSRLPSVLDIIVCQIHGLEHRVEGYAHFDELCETHKTNSPIPFQSLPFTHPVYIMFSSGTTGKPKCIVHGAGGTLMQHQKELMLHCDITEQDNMLFYTTTGWMMWNWMVSTLSLGATITLYEGAPTYPSNKRLFQEIENHSVSVFGTSAKFLSTVSKDSPNPALGYDYAGLKSILSTGSPLLPTHYDYVYQSFPKKVRLSSISGGTDIISCFALGNPILPVFCGEIQCLGLGMAVNVFDTEGMPLIGERGELVCTKPFPSMPVGFWQDVGNQKYRKAYFERFPGVWTHGDYAELTKHHGLIIYGRSDATLNPGGVRIGTAEIYRVLEQIPEIVDSVVIGQNWEDDTRVVLFVQLAQGVSLCSALTDRIKQAIRRQASPRHVPAIIAAVPDIPRTINGKTVEIAVRQIVEGEPVANQDSLKNPEALQYFKRHPALLA